MEGFHQDYEAFIIRNDVIICSKFSFEAASGRGLKSSSLESTKTS